MDAQALVWCDLLVLLLPCGKSAHLEAGWAVGAGKPVIAYFPEPSRPELMYTMFYQLVHTNTELLRACDAAAQTSMSLIRRLNDRMDAHNRKSRVDTPEQPG